MKKLAALLLLSCWASVAWALAPFVKAESVQAGDLPGVMSQVEKKLHAEGFTPIGRYQPKGLPQYGVVVVTYKPILDAIRSMGGSAITAAAIRVGVKDDGSVSYINPEYWYRAYFRKQYGDAEDAVKSAHAALQKALGAGKPFGGDEKPSDLANYRYMLGMERFDSDKNELNTFDSFDSAVKTVRENLAKGVHRTSKVYEVVMPEKKIAVFGVAMNDPKTGDASWVKKIGGADAIAALPYELYIVGNKANALYGRYRIAIAWPTLGMGTFMGIVSTPDNIAETMAAVAGATE